MWRNKKIIRKILNEYNGEELDLSSPYNNDDFKSSFNFIFQKWRREMKSKEDLF